MRKINIHFFLLQRIDYLFAAKLKSFSTMSNETMSSDMADAMALGIQRFHRYLLCLCHGCGLLFDASRVWALGGGLRSGKERSEYHVQEHDGCMCYCHYLLFDWIQYRIW